MPFFDQSDGEQLTWTETAFTDIGLAKITPQPQQKMAAEPMPE